MCFLCLEFKTLSDYPVVIAANRDEYYNRPGQPPQKLADGIWGGRDPRGGGTWLGVNRHGLLVGLTNRGRSNRKNARSRGLLVLDLLACQTADEVPHALQRLTAGNPYNGFSVLAADAKIAFAAGLMPEPAAEPQIQSLAPGIHLLTNDEVNDETDPRIIRGHSLISSFDTDAAIEKHLAALAGVCRDHGQDTDGRDALCVHGRDYGTLSSSLIALHAADPRRHVYRHAPGAPCTSDYEDVSGLLW